MTRPAGSGPEASAVEGGAAAYLERILIRDVRCIARAEVELGPGLTLLVGANAQGKTSFLEAVAILLRLKSPRARRLADVLRHGARGLVVDGWFGGAHLQFYYSPERKKLALDAVEQHSATEYLRVGRAVWFANDDIGLVRGPAEGRRAFLDELGLQVEPPYRETLRAYTRALRSRNRLLRMPRIPRRELEAFNLPFVEAGTRLDQLRQGLLDRLGPAATAAHGRIASRSALGFRRIGSFEGDLAAALAASREEEARLRQTVVGPHRDDVALTVDGQSADRFASEGQQRTVVLAARLAQADLIASATGAPPVLLLDDVFGELDAARREALFRALPAASQKLVTATRADLLPDPDRRIEVHAGAFRVGG